MGQTVLEEANKGKYGRTVKDATESRDPEHTEYWNVKCRQIPEEERSRTGGEKEKPIFNI